MLKNNRLRRKNIIRKWKEKEYFILSTLAGLFSFEFYPERDSELDIESKTNATDVNGTSQYALSDNSFRPSERNKFSRLFLRDIEGAMRRAEKRREEDVARL